MLAGLHEGPARARQRRGAAAAHTYRQVFLQAEERPICVTDFRGNISKADKEIRELIMAMTRLFEQVGRKSRRGNMTLRRL